MVVFILYLGKMNKPMQELSKMTDTYSKAAVGYERIREVVETDNEIKDSRRAIHAPRFKGEDRKSTRLNSSHSQISYAVFCLKKKKKKTNQTQNHDRRKRHNYKIYHPKLNAHNIST